MILFPKKIVFRKKTRFVQKLVGGTRLKEHPVFRGGFEAELTGGLKQKATTARRNSNTPPDSNTISDLDKSITSDTLFEENEDEVEAEPPQNSPELERFSAMSRLKSDQKEEEKKINQKISGRRSNNFEKDMENAEHSLEKSSLTRKKSDQPELTTSDSMTSTVSGVDLIATDGHELKPKIYLRMSSTTRPGYIGLKNKTKPKQELIQYKKDGKLERWIGEVEIEKGGFFGPITSTTGTKPDKLLYVWDTYLYTINKSDISKASPPTKSDIMLIDHNFSSKRLKEDGVQGHELCIEIVNSDRRMVVFLQDEDQLFSLQKELISLSVNAKKQMENKFGSYAGEILDSQCRWFVQARDYSAFKCV